MNEYIAVRTRDAEILLEVAGNSGKTEHWQVNFLQRCDSGSCRDCELPVHNDQTQQRNRLR
jgi:hypothetical protein